MARKKEIKVESFDEWRDKTIKGLTPEDWNIAIHDIRYALNALLALKDNVVTLQILMGETYKHLLRVKYPNGDIDKINEHDLKKVRDRIEANLIDLEPVLNSVKQIERLPTVGEIVRMIEADPDKTISL